jgi:hypothetical protein
MFTNSHRDAILDTMDGTTLTSWSAYCGLITAITDFRAGTVNEATYTSYARPGAAVSFGAVGNTTPTGGRQKANDALVTFPQNTGSNQDVIAWGLWTAASAGTLKMIGFLDADPPILGVASDTTTEDIVAPAHGLATDQRVMVLAAPGAPIPTGLSENVAYYVLAAGLTTDQFRLSTTSGGAAANISVKGASLFMPYTAVTIAANATPEFAVGAIVVQI